jgi:GT2 family glycosyltransferase
MTSPEMSAVLVAWNSGHSLAACIGSLADSAEAAGARLEVIVVDNASSDGCLEDARGLADIAIDNPLNVGYCVAASQGLGRASAPWVLLVNPDVLVDRSFVGELLGAAAVVPEDVATLVPEVRFASNKARVNNRGVELDVAGIPAEIDAGQYAGEGVAAREVFGGSSGLCLLRRSALLRVGGIEPAFFAYLEDVDLAWQLRRAGYRALLVPGALAWHEGSATLGVDSPVKAFLIARNRRLLFRLDGPQALTARAWRSLVELGHATVVAASGAGVLPPVLGRYEALRLRTYTRFVRQSRGLLPAAAQPTTAPRASLAAMLRRKRAARREMHA